MDTKIELERMKFYAYHGVGEQEQTVGNHFEVDLLLTAPLKSATRSDDLNDTIDYSAVYAVVAQEMTTPSKLLEHVAGRIMVALKNTFPQITKVKIRVAKLNPPFGGDLRSAAIILKESFN